MGRSGEPGRDLPWSLDQRTRISSPVTVAACESTPSPARASKSSASDRLTTTLDEHRGATRFVVSTADSLYQDRLIHMGYLRSGDDRFATRWFASSPAVPRYFERFAASIETMIRQRAGMVAVPWEDALLEFLRRIERTGLTWWLYGSAALAVRGLPVEPGDLDLNISDPFLAGELFDDLLITPVERTTGWVANYTGRAFHHTIIEWLSEPRPDLDDPAEPHEQGPLIEEQLEFVHWRGHPIRVPPLTAQLRISEHRGLADRAALIRAALQR